jgi:hypothetical protein
MLSRFSQLCSADGPAAAALWSKHFTQGSTHTWVLLFIVRKLFELGDTLFLAALEKPIIFLHRWVTLLVLLASSGPRSQ